MGCGGHKHDVQREPSAFRVDRAGNLVAWLWPQTMLYQLEKRQASFLPRRVGIRHPVGSLALGTSQRPESSPQISETVMENSFPKARISEGPLGIKIGLQDDG